MKLNSKYFDSIRVKPSEDRLRQPKTPPCDWPGCTRPGRHPAPKGRSSEGEYLYFCMDHVRQYNKSYNYFSGMNDDELQEWRTSAEHGHRPTWKLGQNSWAMRNGGKHRSARDAARSQADPFGFLGGDDGPAEDIARPRRALRHGELKALHEMGLDETATADDVKAQYKKLVKRLHPDANGGSRVNEDKLREIIRAYDHLRSTGYC